MNLERVTFAAGSKLEYIGIVALVNNGMRQFSFPGNDKYWLEEGSLYYRATTNEGDQIVFMAPPPEESIMGLDLPSVRLHVYPEAMQKYMNAPYWQLILHGDDLTGEEPRAITSPEQETTELGWSYQPDGTLHLESQSAATMRVTLYSTDGASIATLEFAPHATYSRHLPTLRSTSVHGTRTEQIIR